MKKLVVVFAVICILGMAYGGKEVTKASDEPEPNITDVIKSFVKDNPIYFDMDGSTEEIEHIQQSKDWAEGERYIVFMKGNVKGEYWTIYLKDNAVVGVLYGEGKTEKRLM